MTEQRFPAGPAPRVRVGRARGYLQVTVWHQDAILVVCDEQLRELYQEGDELVIGSADDDLELRVPARLELRITQLDGDLEVAGVARVELGRVGGDVQAESLGELHLTDRVAGDLSLASSGAISGRGRVAGDVSIEDVPKVALAQLDSDLHAENVANLSVEQVAGDLTVNGLADRLTASAVGGDLQVEGASGASLAVGTVGGDLNLAGGPLSSVQVGTVGGDAELAEDCERLTLGSVGGDVSMAGVGELTAGSVGGDLAIAVANGPVRVSTVGGDAQAKLAGGDIELGYVGGDLELHGAFPAGAGSRGRARVNGDVDITLVGQPSLTISALVSGEVRGASSAGGSGSKQVRLAYGTDENSLELVVGGDLRVRGEPRPSSSSSSSFAGTVATDDVAEWREFGREMGRLGGELGRLGSELAEEIRAALSEAGNEGKGWSEQAARKVEQAARRAEQRVRALEQQSGRGEERARRVRVRFNEREWQLDPERLERIKEQARRAAAEGLSGAIEAVERALGRIKAPSMPVAPVPPQAPAAPQAPEAPGAPNAPEPAGVRAPATGQTVRIEREAPAPAADLEQERLTILRMIAEGRVSPEEGDLLLEALGA